MSRKGWSTLEVPDGWLQVIRGPRPPAVRWPKAPRGRGQDRPQNLNKKEANKGSSQPQAPVPEVRRRPPQVSPAAQERVVRLQTAVDALGDDNSPEAKMLRDALKKAQQEATTVLSACDSTHVPNLSKERGTGCPEPTKRCGKHKTNESVWSSS